ncbi:hypothetical protein [Streptomyces violarus]|uniref:hypothetical protein n=1 Tax=Streptomyces violarus TaxID=67380 RepID=UPI0021BF1CAD|nr:hypothetical protein [Streptomyces violarus]MCT9138460.1 hypothetical protein [Streptomyces violarus]
MYGRSRAPFRQLTTERALKPGWDDGDEFAFGRTLVLDTLHPDQRRNTPTGNPRSRRPTAVYTVTGETSP